MGIKDQLMGLLVDNPGIDVKPGELCFFHAKSKYGTKALKTTTKVKPSLGIGVGIPITEHFGVGIVKRKNKVKTETHQVWQKEACDLYFMSERMLVDFKNRKIEIPFDYITNLTLNKDALTVSCGKEDHVLFMSTTDTKRFMELWALIGEAQKSGIKLSDLKR